MSLFKIIIAVIAIQFLSSCNKDGHLSVDVPSVVVSNNNSTNNSTQGPSDGGGGDICKGKMIESYRVDITQLEAYGRFVLPILRKASPPRLARFSKEDKKNQRFVNTDIPSIYTGVSKSWYIIDCTVQQIAQERKGLQAIQSEQAAFQIGNEIYIDAKRFSQMKMKEQAKLILHELVMSYYLMKYMTLDDICKITVNCTEKDRRSSWKVARPLPYKPLDSKDHNVVRAITDWLWKNQDTLEVDEFKKLLQKNDFDNRFDPFIDPHVVVTSMEDFETHEGRQVDDKVLYNLLRVYNLEKTTQFCDYDDETKISRSSCDVKLVLDNKTGAIDLNINRKSDSKKFDESFYWFNYPDDWRKQSFEKYDVVIFNTHQEKIENYKVGSRIKRLYVVLDIGDLENPKIMQMSFVTYECISVEYSDNKRIKNAVFHQVNDQSEILLDQKDLYFEKWMEVPVELNLPEVIKESVPLPKVNDNGELEE